jgi:hypothetical protein
METGKIRKKLAASTRLYATKERWLPLGLVVAAVAFPLWVTASGVVVERTASATGGGFDPGTWSTETGAVVAAVVLLWVILPAAVGTRYVLDNLRRDDGTIRKFYRVDSPGTLVIPPLILAALVGVVAAALVVRGSLPEVVVLVFGVAGTLVLVRTVAFGHRVYAASTPRLLALFVFLSLTAGAAALAARVASAVASNSGSIPLVDSGFHRTLVATGVDRVGATGYVFGSTGTLPTEASALSLVGAAAPLALSLVYLLGQSAAAAVVRVRGPGRSTTELRDDQRHPGTDQSQDAGSTQSIRTLEGGNDTGPSIASDPTLPDESGSREAESGGTDPGGVATQGPTEDEETAESVSQTRVFTPPDDGTPDDGTGDAATDPLSGGQPDSGEAGGSDDPFFDDSGDSSTADDPFTDTGRDGPADSDDPLTDNAGGRDADSDDPFLDETETAVADESSGGLEPCVICGAEFPADPERTNGPNCEARLDLDLG